MKTISGSLRKNIAGRIMRPAYLMEVYAPLTTYRWVNSTQDISYNGLTFKTKEFNISGLSWEFMVGGKISANISNLNNSMASIVLNGELSDARVTVRIIYLYDKQVFYTVGTTNAVQLNYSIVVKDTIPADIPKIESLRYYKPDGTIDYIGFDNWIGNRFYTYTTNWFMEADIPLYIYKYNRYNEDEAVLLFDGTIDELELSESSCSFSATSEEVMTQYTPRERIIKSNTFNHLPIPGMKIKMFDEVFVLERPRV